MPDSLLGGIIISEFLADPNGANNFDTDGNGRARGGDEFIEFTNTSAVAIDISGLELWDAGRDNWFTFPPGSVLQPGGFALVVRNVQSGGTLPTVGPNDLAFDANYTTNVFNNSGDNLVVYDPSNDEFIQARYNGDPLDDPTATPPNTYLGFSPTATRVGTGEDAGNDQDGLSSQRTPTGFVNGTPTPGTANVCFASGTLIATPTGFVPIDTLVAGQRICTRDAGPQPIKWIYSRNITKQEMQGNVNLCPVMLPGASKLRLSRHHRILVSGKIAQRMFGQDEFWVPAKDLVGCCRITLQSAQSLTYFHILMDGHHVINANGLATESLYLGAEGLDAMTPAALYELETILPSLHPGAAAPLCRVSVAGRRVRQLAARHDKNKKFPVAAF